MEKNSEVQLSEQECESLRKYLHGGMQKKGGKEKLPDELRRFEGWKTIEELKDGLPEGK